MYTNFTLAYLVLIKLLCCGVLKLLARSYIISPINFLISKGTRMTFNMFNTEL